MTHYLGLALALSHLWISEMNSATQNYASNSMTASDLVVFVNKLYQKYVCPQTTCTMIQEFKMISENKLCSQNSFLISTKLCLEDSKKILIGIPTGRKATRWATPKKCVQGGFSSGTYLHYLRMDFLHFFTSI